MKRPNAHEVTLRAVLEMLFMCLCPHKLYYQRMWAEDSGEPISEGDQLYHSMTAQQLYCKQEQVY